MFPVSLISIALLLSCITLCSSVRDVKPPRYAVDLNAPPFERWRDVVKNYAAMYPIIEKELYTIIPKWIAELVAEVAADVDHFLPAPYADEIKGVAKYTNSTVGMTLLGNLAYDFTAFNRSRLGGKGNGKGACTSIIAVAKNGTIFHGRNLDYTFRDLLRNFTIVVDFQRNGTTVYTGTTFAGYIGLLTGMRMNGISVTLDERDAGSLWENMLSAIKSDFHGLAGVVIRETLEDESINFNKAVKALSTRELIAPSYLIVGGVNPYEAAVITRDRLKMQDIWYLNATKGAWYLVETNYDHWEAPPTSDDRRDPAIALLNSMGSKNLNMHSLYQVLSTPPVLSNSTAYTTIMSVKSPGVYYVTIREP